MIDILMLIEMIISAEILFTQHMIHFVMFENVIL